MAYFTKVEQTTCIACGLCGINAPNVFVYNEAGLAYSLIDQNQGRIKIARKNIKDVIEAFISCPSESIMLQKESFKND